MIGFTENSIFFLLEVNKQCSQKAKVSSLQTKSNTDWELQSDLPSYSSCQMLYNSKSISISISTEKKNTQLLYRQLSKTKLDKKNINMKQAMGKL